MNASAAAMTLLVASAMTWLASLALREEPTRRRAVKIDVLGFCEALWPYLETRRSPGCWWSWLTGVAYCVWRASGQTQWFGYKRPITAMVN